MSRASRHLSRESGIRGHLSRRAESAQSVTANMKAEQAEPDVTSLGKSESEDTGIRNNDDNDDISSNREEAERIEQVSTRTYVPSTRTVSLVVSRATRLARSCNAPYASTVDHSGESS